MSELARVEYEALRTTIRERGTLRIWLFLAGTGVWGALALGLSAADQIEGAVTLVPLMALATTFEAVFAVHVGVERIGRFVEVHYESGVGPPCWEATSTMYAKRFPGTGPDALFLTWFWLAALLNFFLIPPGTFSAHPAWLLIRLVAHLVFGWRLRTARTAAAGQRSADLERFSVLKREETKTT